MAWWAKDFALDDMGRWTLAPHAGWRSLYLNGNDPAHGDNRWLHLVSGGLTLAFRDGPLGLTLRGGVNHRITRDDIPAYGARAVAPGVSAFSHSAHLDRTVGAVGAAVNYAITDRASVGVGYEGMFGKETSAHTGSVNFVFPF
jgi:hypothetical protein